MLAHPKMQISDKVKNIPEALSVYINNLVYQLKRKNEEIMVLSLGEAYFDFPFYGFSDADIKEGYHYSDSRGLPELRVKIADYYNHMHNAQVNGATEVLISAGSKPLVFMALQAIINTDDAVIICEPAWLSYPEQIKLVGGEPVYIPYSCAPKDFGKYITSKTRALIINNPNNPAGKVYNRADLVALYQLCRSKGIWIICDEAYSDFVVDDSFVSMLEIVPDLDGIIVLNSLSKNFGISGWRIGYAISNEQMIYHLLKLNQHLITCAPTVLLRYLEKNFERLLEHTLPQAKEVTKKRNALEKYAESIGLHPMGGAATFYIFISVEQYQHTSLDLAMQLLFQHHISVVPGSAYGESTEKFIRISVGTAEEEEMKRAMDIIRKVIDAQEYDGDFIQRQLKDLNE